MFQFHKGSINTPSPLTDNEELLSINSIKVRLILEEGDVERATLKFQFHKGSINTIVSVTAKKVCICFNSIKVRLIPDRSQPRNKHPN